MNILPETIGQRATWLGVHERTLSSPNGGSYATRNFNELSCCWLRLKKLLKDSETISGERIFSILPNFKSCLRVSLNGQLLSELCWQRGVWNIRVDGETESSSQRQTIMPSSPLRNSPPPIAQAGDFRRLGLRRGESCASVIRDAVLDSVRRLISNVNECGGLEDVVVDRQVGVLAASAYRLLDPRYRVQLYERVQLSYPADREDQSGSASATIDLWTVPTTSLDIELKAMAVSSTSDDLGHREPGILSNAREIVRFLQ